MKAVSPSSKETNRLKALRSLKILDSNEEREYDDIAELASTICETPIALVSLVDDKRQWFKAKVGLDVCEINREDSFCTIAIQNPNEILEVFDAREDKRFKKNPYTFGEKAIVFYAGVPLIDKFNNALGTLCVVDHKPRVLNQIQKNSLIKLALQDCKLIYERSIIQYHFR
jgi:GAF domain-containing protein